MQRVPDGECRRNDETSAADADATGRIPAADSSRADAILAPTSVAARRQVIYI